MKSIAFFKIAETGFEGYPNRKAAGDPENISFCMRHFRNIQKNTIPNGMMSFRIAETGFEPATSGL